MIRIIKSKAIEHIHDVLEAIKSIEAQSYAILSVYTVKTPNLLRSRMETHIKYHREKVNAQGSEN